MPLVHYMMLPNNVVNTVELFDNDNESVRTSKLASQKSHDNDLYNKQPHH